MTEMTSVCRLKNYSHNPKVVILFGKNVQDSKLGRQHLSSSEKTAPRKQKRKSGYIQACNKESSQSEHQRSGIRLRNLAFYMGRCKPLGSLNSFLSYACQLSGANPVSLFTLSLKFLQLLSNHEGRQQHLLDHSLGVLIHIWRPGIADGCDISYLLIWQEIFHFTV